MTGLSQALTAGVLDTVAQMLSCRSDITNEFQQLAQALPSWQLLTAGTSVFPGLKLCKTQEKGQALYA